MKITVDGKTIAPAVARKVLHIQVECGGLLTDGTMDALAKDLSKPGWQRPAEDVPA